MSGVPAPDLNDLSPEARAEVRRKVARANMVLSVLSPQTRAEVIEVIRQGLVK